MGNKAIMIAFMSGKLFLCIKICINTKPLPLPLNFTKIFLLINIPLKNGFPSIDINWSQDFLTPPKTSSSQISSQLLWYIKYTKDEGTAINFPKLSKAKAT